MADERLLSGRYRLGEVIGMGGMSEVYTANDTLLGRDVAVKMMRADLARDDSFVERFRREAQNVAKLNHHAIVAVYDTGVTDDEPAVPYIVMELVHGETLRQIIRNDGPLAPKRAAQIMAEVCHALQFSHEAGIVHRDIKPANIMLTRTGAVKVMDFGIARALSDATSSMTQTATVIGTAQYLSPEQARGKAAEPRSDIYSVGCVLYEVLTGEAPFTGETPLSVAYQHVEDMPTPPSELIDGGDARELERMDAIVLTAMAKAPADRYDSAADMGQDLMRLSRGEVPLAAKQHEDGYGAGAAAGAAGGAAGGAAATEIVDRNYPPTATALGAAGAAGAGAGAGMAGAGMAGDPQANSPYGFAPYEDAAMRASAAQRRDMEAFDNDYYDPDDEWDDDDDSYYDSDGRRKRSPWIVAAWVVVLLALAGAGTFIATNVFDVGNGGRSSQAQFVDIPRVQGMSASEARRTLEEAGLVVAEEDRPDPKIERGNVINTNPAPGSQVKQGSTVTVLVSTGKEITEVPDLAGLTTSQAEKKLKAAGLTLDKSVKEESSEDVPKGKIISHNPASGSQVSKGTKVAITVSTGQESVRVPVVSGQSLETAKGNLEAAGFEVQVTEVDGTEAIDTVLAVANEGQEVEAGSTIEVKVSRGNQLVMPNMINSLYTDAETSLQEEGWMGKFNITRKSTSDLGKVDRIAKQYPKIGEPAYKDQDIDVTVYEFSLLPDN